jgi:hypothetical protein
MDWRRAVARQAPIKLVVNGSQLWNRANRFEGWNHFATEQRAFADWLLAQRIDGGVFLSGTIRLRSRVTLDIAWTDDGKRHQVTAAAALLNPGAGVQPEAVEWVYVGSISVKPDGQFAADMTGTLVGFVHDANSIIESVHGLGIGAYGSVSGNPDKLPPEGAPIEFIVEIPRGTSRPAKP